MNRSAVVGLYLSATPNCAAINAVMSTPSKDTNKDIEEIKKYFKPGEKNFLLHNKEDLVLEANILKLGELLYLKRNEKKGRIKYNSINNKELHILKKKS